MRARNVYLRLKPDSSAEFRRIVEHDIIPLLRKQSGFQDLITFVLPGGTEAMTISLWEDNKSAESYARLTYPEVLDGLAKVIEGTPRVQIYDVFNSTFHKILVPAGV